ncbi:mannose-6-phosphate isomerase, type 2 [Limimonas halophila]|uniref:Mannose-6-phosphate isomerase, type 2 n=1 Tax=Limimonas halophila TaxID=1082479 RepID=A0A1G7NLT5_9PROT|nr:phosphomannose isomerase type II C-terminal cupin domain [Limimonas halophila]SDF75028.1 mannose-6-phosphate isomerase, type 2 [Limimonas halophila]
MVGKDTPHAGVSARIKGLSSADSMERSAVFRPWGSFRSVHWGDGFQVKHIRVEAGQVLSLQRHRHRAEHWVVVRGVAEVTCDDAVFHLDTNQTTSIPLGAVHRLANPGEEPLDLIEVQIGAYLGEDDIERFADIYGRSDRLNSAT